jgi:RimJ/RimL family protein N-acetyltransferase
MLVLRPLTGGDFDALLAIASDPLVWEQHPSKDRAQEPVFRGWFADALASGGALVAVDRRDGQVFGTSRFGLHDTAESEIEIGWTFLARSHWGGTFNREIKRLMLGHAFQAVQYVVFVIHVDNIRSQRAVEHLGAVRQRVEADAHGRGVNVVFRLSSANESDHTIHRG